MTSKDIEVLATTAVKESLITTGYLDPYISEGDREPFVDGTIYIYKNSKKTKQDCIGCVSTQVKGKVVPKVKKDSISYPVSIIDLKFYLSKGGCIYFVVYISEDGCKKQIYYRSFDTAKIYNILENTQNTTSISLKFKPFPDIPSKRADIILNLYHNIQKQHSFSSETMLTFEDNTQQNITEVITTIHSFEPISNPIDHLLNDELCFYGKMEGSSVLIPFKTLPNDFYIVEEEKYNISVNNNVFYTSISRYRSPNEIKLQIGKSLTFTINSTKKTMHFQFSPVQNLNDRLIDMDFFLQIYKNKGFFLNDTFLNFDLSAHSPKKYDYEGAASQLLFMQNIRKALDMLNIYKDINFEMLTKDEEKNLSMLVTAFIDRKPIRFMREDSVFLYKMKIQNINILFVCKKDSDLENTFIISDFFDSSHLFSYIEEKTNKRFISSCYNLLSYDNYNSTDNMVLNNIIPYYNQLTKRFPDEPLIDQLNFDLLNILKAYDESNNPELLQAAQDIALWLYGNDKFNKKISTINLYQVYRRQRELTPEENKILYKITEDTDSSLILKVGAHLLSGSIIPAQILFENLSPEEQEEFRKYPINKFGSL